MAKEAGSELVAGQFLGIGPNLRALDALDATWTGQYVDYTNVFQVMSRVAVPKPTALTMLAVGGLDQPGRRCGG